MPEAVPESMQDSGVRCWSPVQSWMPEFTMLMLEDAPNVCTGQTANGVKETAPSVRAGQTANYAKAMRNKPAQTKLKEL